MPGYESLLRISRILLAEHVPADGRVRRAWSLEDMVLAHPCWQFDGVDPSQPMLDLARSGCRALVCRATAWCCTTAMCRAHRPGRSTALPVC